MSADPWADFLRLMDDCCNAAKLSAFHAKEASFYASKTARFTRLTVFFVRAAIKQRKAAPHA